jgi:hypothetical protein
MTFTCGIGVTSLSQTNFKVAEMLGSIRRYSQIVALEAQIDTMAGSLAQL